MLTGITNQMTANAPLSSLIIPQVHQYVKNSTLVAHNASFDSKFFHSEMSKVGLRTNVDFICTLLLSRRLYPTLDNHKLGTLAKRHGIKSQGKSHRALADALVTAELFIKISHDLQAHLSSSNLTPHHYLHSQKQPLNSFLKPLRRTDVPSIKPQTAEVKSLIVHAPQESPQAKPINNATGDKSANKAITESSAVSEPKRIDAHLQHHEIVSWIKTSTGLRNKKTGLLITFADTLRDVFPIPGYQVKGGHPYGFIKDSEIDNPQPNENEKPSQIIPQSIQKLCNFLKSDTPETKSQNQASPKTADASVLKDGFGQKSFSNGDHYEGMFSNGKFHGQGKYTWKSGSSYEGNFINGVREGLGTYTWSNGTTYAGQWIAAKMFGHGTKKNADGTIDIGNFKDGLLDGLGTRIWKSEKSSGEGRFEGHFQNGLRHGRGIHMFANGDRYDGDWIEDIRNGHGVYTWPNGNQYKGGWVNGRMAGQGSLTWLNEGCHEGMFANGLRHGKGIYKAANGEVYSGIWLAGELDQECKWCDAYGNVYEGGLKNFEFHGDGTLTWSDGAKYEGGYLDGLRHGKGTFTTKSKAKYSGHWKEGILIDAYDEWIEKQAAKFSSRYKKLIKMKQICDAHSEKWIALNPNPQKNSKTREYEEACQSLVEKLDILLAGYDAFYEEFFIDINDCYFCCFEEDYEDQIHNGFEEKINNITTLRDDLYKIYLGLI
jgi:DNA polymerase III epsilon subunit-like protein